VGAGFWENSTGTLVVADAFDAYTAVLLAGFALVYKLTGEFELAESNFREALDAGAGSRARNNYAASLYAQGRYLEAAAAFREVTTDTLYSGRPRAFVNLGLALLQTQETPEAKSAFSRALLTEPRNSTALLELTQIELTEGDVAAASGYYERYRAGTRRQTARALILGVEIARLNGDANMEASNMLALRNLYAETPIYKAWTAAQKEQR
ncbi:MAG: tetratricopeptide repeat protein, partial [Pseudomonadota bacterium]|nr:tetratricopeptide repeat protein [Pseudomonadota bacterium]